LSQLVFSFLHCYYCRIILSKLAVRDETLDRSFAD
jgi:hypothetical protein